MTEPHTRVAAYATVIANASILLVRLAEASGVAGLWAMPGGGVEWGESPIEAVVRELREETGLEGHVEALLGVTSFVDEIHTIRIYYKVRVVGGTLRDETGGTSDHAAWVPLAGVWQLPIGWNVEEALQLAGQDSPDFAQSWDWVLAFYDGELLARAEWAWLRPLRELIAKLRVSGYAHLLRAGQSMYIFCVSRSRAHGLRENQPHIMLDPKPDGTLWVRPQIPGQPEFLQLPAGNFFDDPQLRAVLTALAREPIT